MARSNLVQRVLAAAVFGPALLGLFWFGGWVLLIGWGAVVALGTREFYQMLARKGLHPWMRSGLIASVCWCVAVHIKGEAAFLPVFTGLLLLGLSMALFRGQPGARLLDAGATLLGTAYVGFLGSFVLLIRNAPLAGSAAFSPAVLAIAILTGIWACDIAAYFAGRAFGKRHPFPTISPGKTEAGFIGGLIVAVAAVGFANEVFHFLPFWKGIGLGGVVGVGAPTGDLIESMVKRDIGVKDASELIPGHGGVLDRFDSVLFVFPLAYLYLILIDAF